MKIKDIGGEFALIKRIAEKAKDKTILKGIGDDAAVLKLGKKQYVITTDTLAEGDHFSLKWFSPEQIGKKAMEINVSDIGAMGAIPKYALVSLVLPKKIEVEFIDKLYQGMRSVCKKYSFEIIGGNITHGKQLVIDIDMIGVVKDLCLRSSARPGDFILVSGDLGASRAGLNLFLNKKADKRKFPNVINSHLEPRARFHKVKPFLRYINSMIDVSDGLASEITRICEQSNCGAVVYKDNLPIKDETREAAKIIKKDAVDYALFGGEDFELVFTVSEKNLSKVKGFLVGEIRKKKGVYLYSKGKESLVKKKGYDHFT